MASTPKRVKQSALRPASRTKRCRLYLLIVCAYLLPIILIALSSTTFISTVQAVSTDVVINQVYIGGGDGDGVYRCDYVELYNKGVATVDLSTYSIQFAGATASTWTRKNLSKSIAPGQYYLVRLNCATSITNPSGSDITNYDESSAFDFSETGGGKTAVVSNQTTLSGSCPTGGGIVDFFGYGTANCFETAVEPLPSDPDTQAMFRTNGVDTDNNSVDFTTGSPNPRYTALSGIIFDTSEASCIFNSVGVATSFSWTHPITATYTSRVLIVGISTYATAGTPGALSVTYGGVSLTRQGIITNNNTSAEIWRATESQIAARSGDTITVNLGAGVTQYAVGGSSSFYGVNQTTTNRNFIGNTGNTGASSTNDPSVSVPSASGELVIDTVATEFAGANNLIVGSGQVERWNGATDSNCNGNPATEPNLTLSSVGAGSTEAGAASVPMTWNAAANNVNWAIGAVSLIPLATTEVELTSFEAFQVKGGNLLQWETGYEVDNLGFNLYREVDGRRALVNPSLVAGSAFVAGQGVRMTAGRSYRWFDREGAAGARYWLEDVDLNGERKVYGPVLAEAKYMGRSTSEQSQSLMLEELNYLMAGGDGAAQAKQLEHPASLSSFEGTGTGKGLGLLRSECNSQETSAKSAESAQERQRAIAEGAAVKVLVNHNGWYRVGQQELLAAGLKPDVEGRLLQLYADGEEVPMVVNTSAGSQLGPNGSIEFYGQGLNTLWTDTRTYWLIIGSTPGERIRRTKVRSLGQPTASRPTLPEKPVQPSQSGNSTGTTQPATTGGTATTTQQGNTLFNWLPALPLPSQTFEGQSSKASGQRATQPAVADKPSTTASASLPEAAATIATAATPETAAAREAKTAAPSSNATASPVATARPRPMTPVNAAPPKLNAQTATSPEPAIKKSANRRRIRRRQSNKRKARTAARRKLKSHAALADSGAADVAESFNYTIERADRTLYFSALQNGEASNFFGKIVGQNTATLNLNLHHLATSSGQATLEVSLQGAVAGDHLVSVKLNGTDVGQLSFTGPFNSTAQFQVANSLLHNGENIILLTALGGQTDISLVDRVSLNYPHTYEADNNALTFSVERQQGVTVEGFGNSNVRMLDITDPDRPIELVGKPEQDGAGYALAFISTQGGALLATTDNRIEHPLQVTRNQPSSWHSYEQGADLLIVTHRDFIDALAPLVALRQAQGMTVALVDVEDVYDEFSFGAHSRPALRDFLDWTRSRWQRVPRYLLLVGDCSYDPRDYLRHGQFDFVPTNLIDTRFLETASDDALADFNSDGVPEMAVGRLPVRTAAEAATVVGKIVSFQNGNLRRGALMVSDQASDFDFEAANRAVRSLLPPGMDAQFINRGSTDPSAVRAAIINGINQGPLLINYLGHGSIESWTGAGILRSADVPQLTNEHALSVFVMMTCLNGFVQDVNSTSLGEALMRSGSGGAAAVWASSGLTEPDQQALMNQQLVRSLLGDQPLTIGEAIIKAKGATQNMDVRRTWMLLGDPTTRLR